MEPAACWQAQWQAQWLCSAWSQAPVDVGQSDVEGAGCVQVAPLHQVAEARVVVQRDVAACAGPRVTAAPKLAMPLLVGTCCMLWALVATAHHAALGAG